MTDSFKARTTLKVGTEQYEILSLNALKSLNVDPPALFPEDPAGKPLALRRRRQCHQERYRRPAEVGSESGTQS